MRTQQPFTAVEKVNPDFLEFMQFRCKLNIGAKTHIIMAHEPGGYGRPR